ncbi:MAG: heat-shock protein Hsp20 [Planctomycetes bacterium]|jgi:HSP20 family molecular chaperone IbpA|nr:heat-shock protein Hsp20 [Planctomycetota bacterium]
MATKDPETWMWERARAKLEQAERKQKSLFPPRRPGTRHPSWQPPVDIFEDANELWLLMAVPGVKLDSVALEIHSNRIVVRGERALPSAFRTATVHRIEIPHGRFERAVELPAGRYEFVEHKLRDGCLFLNLKKIH